MFTPVRFHGAVITLKERRELKALSLRDRAFFCLGGAALADADVSLADYMGRRGAHIYLRRGELCAPRRCMARKRRREG
jgi:hypothetical protein